MALRRAARGKLSFTFRAFLGGLALGSTLLGAPSARAESCLVRPDLSTCVDSDNLWPHPGAGSFFALGGTRTAPTARIGFGLVFSYFSRPIQLVVSSPDKVGTTLPIVDNALDATLLWNVGITDRLELTAAAPVVLLQDGTGVGPVLGTNQQLERSAARDLRFGAAFAIINRPRIGEQQGLGLTARLDFAAPLATAGAFSGAATMTAAPSLTLDERLGRLLFTAEVGARLRGESKIADAVIGSQRVYGLGAAFEVIPRQRLSLGAEAFALQTLAAQPPRVLGEGAGSARALVPAEWILSASTSPLLAGDIVLMAGGGGPIPLSPEAVTAPRFRFDLGIRYAPTGHDRDGDGVLDRDDKCPDQPEDRDGFQDADGCPDPDNDNDGIPDTKDRCRDEPEDFDGFQDADGCPDLDDDNDGIPDDKDKCRNEPEDKDGFEDADGCPDPDNDKDGIPDVKDRCPNGPEDFDGFRDEDGCPDPDNDLDGIPDVVDQCPNDPEDKDGFQDADGCPDPDNDEDGILDAADRCPIAAETIDGVQDEDGCPEPGAKSLVRWDGERVLVDGLGRFGAGSPKLTPALEKQAKMAAQLVRGHAPLESVILEGFPDRTGDASVKAIDLAARRAEAWKAAFVAAGIPADRIIAAAGDLAQKRDARAPQIEITVRRAAIKRIVKKPAKPAQESKP